MAQSRKRAGRPAKHTADIPTSQRTSGHLMWALLVAVFGAMIGYFASGGSITGATAGLLAGGALGWYLGTKMEKDAGAR
ncbi:hypothetical protein SAMN05444008_12547 [Cnuella takakiae]|uniref:Glycine zipper n=1 Tax=Cnuella takakiae TaxID=1302690 RepID=A0A1M5IT24_9BACT|nr:hypothetical protein [Cnuella takakiae]SHG31492.1 hypothetical protein SAMN05444008_12547 [Cnuella takakiae]